MNLTFQTLLTPEGVVAAAALATALVALIRNVFPVIDVSACSNSSLGTRIPRELPIRTIRVLVVM